jgi:hypothetical protein
MSLSDLINVQISATGNLPGQAGFGIPLIAGYHTHYPDLVRYYSSLAGLITDGFAVTDDIYLAAAAIMAQSPSVLQFAVGRRTHQDTQVLKLTLTSTSTLDTYKVTIVDAVGGVHLLSMPSTGVVATDAASLATAATALSVPNCTVTSNATSITLTQAAGKLLDLQGWDQSVLTTPILQVADTSTDPGLAADLAAIQAADDNWYGLCLANNAPSLVAAAMAWVEPAKKIGAFNCSDTAIELATTGNVALTTQALGYARSAGLYSRSKLKSFSGAAALGMALPPDPGSITWAYKNLVGVPSDKLSQSVQNNVLAAGWNYFTTFKGSRVLQPGVSVAGEFMDIAQGVDWFTDLLVTNLFALLVGEKKVPFTDKGGDKILSVLKAANQKAVQQNFADPGDDITPAPSATVPKVGTISAVNRAKRIFAGSTVAFKLAGAIQNLTLTGTVTP